MAESVVIRDTFAGTDATTSLSGSAPFTTVDTAAARMQVVWAGSPATGDKLDYITHFPTGDITLRLIYTSATTLEFRRISTLTGNTFDVLIATLTNPYTTPGQIASTQIKVTRGAANDSTSFTVQRGLANVVTFTTTGEQTPTGADFLIVGTSFRHYDDVSGRVPDGGGDPSLVAGHWEVSFQVQPYEHLGIISNRLVTLPGAFDSLFYRLADHGLPTADYKVLGTYYRDLEPTESFPFAYAYVGIRTDQFGNGYWLEIADFGDDPGNGFYVSIYKVTDSTTIDGDGSNFFYISGPDWYDEALGDGPHTIWIAGSGTTITADLDSGYKTATAVDTELSSVGDPGIGATSGDTTLHYEIQFDIWEVLADIATVDPCGNLWSAHDFSDTRVDIDGQITDADIGNGTWIKHPTAAAVIANAAGKGKVVGAGRAVYRDADINALPPNYCVNVRSKYPQVVGPDPGSPGSPGTPRTLIWSDSFDGSAGSLGGRVHDGGTWTRIDGGAAAEVQLTGDGEIMQPSGPFGHAVYQVEGLTLPADYDVEIDIRTTSNEYGEAGVIVRSQGASGQYWWRVLRNESVGPYNNFYHAATGGPGAIVGGLGTANKIGSPGDPPVTIETRVRGVGSAPAVIRVYWGGTSEVAGACGPTGIPEIVFYDGQFGQPRVNYDSGPPGLWFTVQNTENVNPLRISAIRIYDSSTCSPGYPGGTADVGEVASTELMARYDATTDTGYVLREMFDHSAGGAPVGTYVLEERTNGVPTRMRSTTRAIAHDAINRLRLQPIDNSLYAEVEGEPLWLFDLDTDTADETGLPVAVHATGDPGLGGSDMSGDGSYLELSEYRVYAEAEVVYPCEGPPDNPYPWDPPPVLPPAPVYLYEKQGGLWRPTLVPVPEVQVGDVHATARGARRQGTDLAIMANLAWRYASAGLEQPPPPDTPLPPFFDPCEELPPTGDPPTVELGPPPLVLFGMSNTPPTIIGSAQLLTGTRRALGPWSILEMTQAAARGGAMVCAIGGYEKFRTGGNYDPAKMDAWIASHLPYSDQLHTFQDAGTFAGQSIFDDFDSPNLWPPRGVDDSEIARVAAVWKFYYPWMRLGIRGRASQFRAAIPNISFCECQFKYWGSPSDPTAFRNLELPLAQSRGWLILWALNYVAGGTGGIVGPYQGHYEMTAAQVQTAGLVFATTAANNMGILGYTYTPTYLTRPGMLDAFATVRNALPTA